MIHPWGLFLSTIISAITGLFSGLLGRLLEEWRYRPRLVVDFSWETEGFRREWTRSEGGTQITDIYVRARVRNEGRRVAKKCRPYLVKVEEVLPSGLNPTKMVESRVLGWPRGDYDPRDIPKGIDQFFDVVVVVKDNNQPGWLFKTREPSPELAGYKGTYRLTVLVAGDDVEPDGRKIDVTYNGEWEHLRAQDAGHVDLG
jgi:hypothetical protein